MKLGKVFRLLSSNGASDQVRQSQAETTKDKRRIRRFLGQRGDRCEHAKTRGPNNRTPQATTQPTAPRPAAPEQVSQPRRAAPAPADRVAAAQARFESLAGAVEASILKPGVRPDRLSTLRNTLEQASRDAMAEIFRNGGGVKGEVPVIKRTAELCTMIENRLADLQRGGALEASPESLPRIEEPSVPVRVSRTLAPVREDAIDWCKREVVKEPCLPQVNPQCSPLELVDALLNVNPGICVGESHDSPGSKRFVIDAVARAEELGLKTLFLEHLLPEHQPLLDSYAADCAAARQRGETMPQMPAQLQGYLAELDHGFRFAKAVLLKTMYSAQEMRRYSFEGLVRAAVERGVKVVGLEHSREAYHSEGRHGKHRESPKDQECRFAILHKQAATKMSEADGKWIALVGAAHLVGLDRFAALASPHENRSLPGIAELVGCPAVLARDAIHVPQSYSLGEHQRHEFTYAPQGVVVKPKDEPVLADFAAVYDGERFT